MRETLGEEGFAGLQRSWELGQTPRPLTDTERAVLRRVVAPLLADLAASGLPVPDIRAEAHEEREESVCGWIQGPDGTGEGICWTPRRPSRAVPGTAPVPEEPAANTDDLQIHTGDAPPPAAGGLPCPPGIPPITLSHAETSKITRLARDWKQGLLNRARLAFHLRWSAWRRRHQARARWHHLPQLSHAAVVVMTAASFF